MVSEGIVSGGAIVSCSITLTTNNLSVSPMFEQEEGISTDNAKTPIVMNTYSLFIQSSIFNVQ